MADISVIIPAYKRAGASDPPRGLWQGKPLIGIDYAIARGQGWADQTEGEAGVGATISTGMIGLWK